MENSKQPAFAVSKEMCEMSEIETYPYGLTKREYIAAKAMQGLLSNDEHIKDEKSYPEITADLAVQYADALLCALANER